MRLGWLLLLVLSGCAAKKPIVFEPDLSYTINRQQIQSIDLTDYTYCRRHADTKWVECYRLDVKESK